MDGRPRGGELDGIRKKIPHDLLEPRGVAPNREVGKLRAEPDTLLLRGGTDGLYRVFNHVQEIDRLKREPELPRENARHVEEIFDEAQLSQCAPFDGRQARGGGLGVELAGAQHLRPRQDRGQRRTQLVREDREESVFRSIRRLGCFPRVAFCRRLCLRLGPRMMVRPMALDTLDSNCGSLRHKLEEPDLVAPILRWLRAADMQDTQDRDEDVDQAEEGQPDEGDGWVERNVRDVAAQDRVQLVAGEGGDKRGRHGHEVGNGPTESARVGDLRLHDFAPPPSASPPHGLLV
jgi:hypothetical protein